ncbi:alpha/beta hydrolase [Sporosarcina sp. BI001-red]|uniref:alpha/beta hydrolase n=1 Tax=Sporosarcina sp. BI001-red TaxID=2282866 RepID=UPI000E22642C|nr:alpha/beta hydrolase [Sporosarcina sp. BI001-red]REB05491.1 alpha/beta hydrolase [Sporosarcina sp. BI001-red]
MMQHVFRRGTSAKKPVLLLLHGTGGTEHDLLSLAELVDSEASVLSVRGNVLENGLPRFFKRLAEGVFDEQDLVFRTKELKEFLTQAAIDHQFDPSNIVAIGYSNGANIAASLLFHYADAVKGAILHHPMVPIRNVPMPDLTGIHVWIGAGANDPICTQEESVELKDLLEEAGASVGIHWEHAGHQLTTAEVKVAKSRYEQIFR